MEDKGEEELEEPPRRNDASGVVGVNSRHSVSSSRADTLSACVEPCRRGPGAWRLRSALGTKLSLSGLAVTQHTRGGGDNCGFA